MADRQQREIILDRVAAALDTNVLGLADLKEPHPVKGQGRLQGTKRLPTAIELLEKKVDDSLKAELKRR